MIQMGSLHALAGTEAILIWKPLRSQYCQLTIHQAPDLRELRAWIKSKIVMSASDWPSGRGCPNYFNATFIFAALKPSKPRWRLFWDTCTGLNFPNHLVYLQHLFVLLYWKLLCLIITSGLCSNATSIQDYGISLKIKAAVGKSSLEPRRLDCMSAVRLRHLTMGGGVKTLQKERTRNDVGQVPQNQSF